MSVRPALAHPLGNFTINHLAKVRIEAQRVHVHYVLDIAEIPSFQIMRAIGAFGSAEHERLNAWAQQERATVMSGLRVEADGRLVSLSAADARVETRPGAGGLPTLYWTDDLSSKLGDHAGRAVALHILDRTYENRIGWKDIVVAPDTEPTHELRHYPNALLGSPRDVVAMALTVSAQGFVQRAAVVSSPEKSASQTQSQVRSNTLSDMLSLGAHNPLWVVLTLLVAIGLGAFHALEPGHGKTLLAVSLVGSRATVKQALLLAAALTLAHTAGVLALGVVLVFAAGWIVPENIYPWLTFFSGLLVGCMGANALARLVRRFRGSQLVHAGHTHEDGQFHAHLHEHGHGHDHGWALSSDQPLSFRGVVLIAMSGNIAPCPAALVVLLAALTLHEVAFGLSVVVAFSVGLAAVLTALGIALVRSAGWIAQRPQFDMLTTYAPLASACVISIIGAVMLARGAVAAFLSVPPIAVVALTLTAIAAFVLSASHTDIHAHAHAHTYVPPVDPQRARQVHDRGAAL